MLPLVTKKLPKLSSLPLSPSPPASCKWSPLPLSLPLIPGPFWIPAWKETPLVEGQLLEVDAAVCVSPLLQSLEQSLVRSRCSVNNSVLALAHSDTTPGLPQALSPVLPDSILGPHPGARGRMELWDGGRYFFLVIKKKNS